jgi:hypothetical protein
MSVQTSVRLKELGLFPHFSVLRVLYGTGTLAQWQSTCPACAKVLSLISSTTKKEFFIYT